MQLVLTRYGVERLLYRLGRTSTGERFVLKGAVLFYLWDGVPHRPTRDVDFLAYGDVSHDAIVAAFRHTRRTNGDVPHTARIPRASRARLSG